VPKRLRWYLEREPRAISAVLHILLGIIEAHLRRSSNASSQARFGAVSFIHRFGASLNRQVQYHCCVIDGVFGPAEQADDAGPQTVRFRAAADLTPEALAAITEQVRIRVLRWFARSGLIEPEDVRELLAWENSGFSLDAAVRVGAHDRAGLERLLRYYARVLHVRFAQHCCRWQPKGGCLFMAECSHSATRGRGLLGVLLRTSGIVRLADSLRVQCHSAIRSERDSSSAVPSPCQALPCMQANVVGSAAARRSNSIGALVVCEK
jgi:hypothetical protein